jgi:hypothetical protein
MVFPTLWPTDELCLLKRSIQNTLCCAFLSHLLYVDLYNEALRIIYYQLRRAYGLDSTSILPWASGEIESV